MHTNHACMCLYTYIHPYIHTYMNACMHTYIHTYINMYKYTWTYTYTYTYTYIHASGTDDWEPRITMVTWESCLEHSLPWQVFDKLTPPFALSRQSALLKKACTAYEQLSRQSCPPKDSQDAGFCPCDAVSCSVGVWVGVGEDT